MRASASASPYTGAPTDEVSRRCNIALGIGLVTIMLPLTVTGYLLHYACDETPGR